MLGNYLQQTTSADDIFRCIFFLALFGVKGKLHRLIWVYTCQNATLLEITCRSSFGSASVVMPPMKDVGNDLDASLSYPMQLLKKATELKLHLLVVVCLFLFHESLSIMDHSLFQNFEFQYGYNHKKKKIELKAPSKTEAFGVHYQILSALYSKTCLKRSLKYGQNTDLNDKW